MDNYISILLKKIVNKIEIKSDFTICHPDYPTLELQPELVAIFQRTSPQLQRKYLISQVQNYLHDIYFSHSLMSFEEIAERAQSPLEVKNNVVNGIDIEFCQKLHQSNTGNGYIDTNWQVTAEADNDELVVAKGGLYLHINPQQHLPKDLDRPNIGDVVPIYLPNNLAGVDTYIIVGDQGVPDQAQSVQIYFNFTPDAAIDITQKITQELNKLKIPFQFDILHNPSLFYQYNSGSLRLSQSNYFAVQTFLQKTYEAHQTDFSPNVPLFSKQLALGLGLAEVPNTGETFGEQRCEVLATGLVIAMEQDKSSLTDKLEVIYQVFSDARIDWLQPYLNPSMSDSYQIYVAE
jgi:HopA1 effector protein family